VRFVTSVVLLVAAGVWLVACPPSFPDASSCAHTCQVLATCGLLPSALGFGTGDALSANCAGRCEDTDPNTALTVAQCVSNGGTDPCDPNCGQVASCLANAFPGQDVVGQAGVRIVAVLAPASPADGGVTDPDGALEASAASCNPATCPWDSGCPQTGLSFAGQDAGAWCSAGRVSGAKAFFFRGSAFTFAPTTTCEDDLLSPVTIEFMPPGTGLVGLELRGSVVVDASTDGTAPGPEDAGPDAGTPPAPQTTPFCREYYGPVVALVAGQVVTAAVPLPMDPTQPGFECEEGPTLCADQIDNDNNGLTDCSDPRCAPQCTDAGPPPPDGGTPDGGANEEGGGRLLDASPDAVPE
jgi:hypothetical protein